MFVLFLYKYFRTILYLDFYDNFGTSPSHKIKTPTNFEQEVGRGHTDIKTNSS